MMGNEQSQLSGIEIEEKAVEVSDFWTQHTASIVSSEHVTTLSVFIGELFVNGPLWSTHTPLEKCSKNLMIYRHPCILKYVHSWQKNSRYHLAIEEVKPLSHVLPTLSTLQICVGIHSILKAVCFLHEKANVSHNNICIASIYVAKDGSWKLGGMEYLCSFKNLSCDYLKKSRSNRYNKAVDPNEDKNLQNNISRKDSIDAFAFSILVCELLKARNDDEIPVLSSFRGLCHNQLQNINVSQRPKLSVLLDHEFFNHDFIAIHSFLLELPLKLPEERRQFFLALSDKLKNFNEDIVGSQLGGLLLSRMVLLDKTAQTDLLPRVLCFRQGNDDKSKGIFTEHCFKKFLAPNLLKIFGVRDAQIRLLLLNHFSHFMQIFTKEELQSCILPELLLGIKDTNDHLVAVTLRTLADLIPTLGAATVVGGKRAKLFNDGRPTVRHGRKSRRNFRRQIVAEREIALHIENEIVENSDIQLPPVILPERPRPDGEEVETSTEEVEQSQDGDLDNWEDWDLQEHNHISENASTEQDVTIPNNNSTIENSDEFLDIIDANNFTTQTAVIVPKGPANAKSKRSMPDITELDIKNHINGGGDEDFDFFQDMEPVISSTNKFLITEELTKHDVILEKAISSKLNLNIADDNDDGWGDGDWE